MSSANVIQLQALLAEKFPGLHLGLTERPALQKNFWPTGLPQLDAALDGGLTKGGVNEIVSGGNGSGSATLIRHLLSRAAGENAIAALIDGSDSFDVTQLDEKTVARMLWIRCRAAEEALKAADLILRDGNLPIILLDLMANPEKQLRRIPATTWYRFQNLVEETPAVFAVFTPRPMVPSAKTRLVLQPHFRLSDLERDAADLLAELQWEVSSARSLRHKNIST
jgi:hypothetical protein